MFFSREGLFVRALGVGGLSPSTGIPRETASNDTNLSLYTLLGRPLALSYKSATIVPANLTVRVPSDRCTTFVFTHDNLSMGRNVKLLGSMNIVSDSCHNRLGMNIVGRGHRDCAVVPNREVTRLMVVPMSYVPIYRISRLSSASHNRNNFNSANGGWWGSFGVG